MTTPMLETLAVSKSFALRGDGRHKGHSGFLKAVDQVSLTLGASETLGIAGESGCGKSTLAKLITGLLAPDSGGIMFQGAELTRLTPDMRRLFRRSVQMIFRIRSRP